MKTLLLNVSYTDDSNKFWQDSYIKNMKVTLNKGETIHDAIKRVIEDVDYMKLSYKGKPQSNVYVDTKTGTKIVGYIYRGQTEIEVDYSYKKAYFDVWVDISEVKRINLPDIETV